MDIFVKDNKLRRALQDDASRKKQFGAEMAEKLRLRLAALDAADSLADFWPPKSGPERCHELLGKLAGIFSIDVKQPYRLLFRPGDATSKRDPKIDEQQWWKTITTIEIMSIEDTHG